jgi:hypothetical protein
MQHWGGLLEIDHYQWNGAAEAYATRFLIVQAVFLLSE